MTEAKPTNSVECPDCGRGFSTNHAMRTHHSMIHGKEPTDCEYCGEGFTPPEPDKDRFCSLDCYHEWMNGEAQPHTYNRLELECNQCGESFELPVSLAEKGGVYCSNDCKNEAAYKGNSSLNHEFRYMELNGGWRASVFERDDYTCVKCGERGGSLQAHHVTPVSELIDGCESREEFEDIPEFRDVSNGKTVCTDCHDKLH